LGWSVSPVQRAALDLMATKESFSRRNRFSGTPKEITVREDAPEGLRVAVLETLHSKFGWKPSALRDAICSVLRLRPDSGNWGILKQGDFAR
jgi:hypothetical protein